jgi:hypothetical protein
VVDAERHNPDQNLTVGCDGIRNLLDLQDLWAAWFGDDERAHCCLLACIEIVE